MSSREGGGNRERARDFREGDVILAVLEGAARLAGLRAGGRRQSHGGAGPAGPAAFPAAAAGGGGGAGLARLAAAPPGRAGPGRRAGGAAALPVEPPRGGGGGGGPEQPRRGAEPAARRQRPRPGPPGALGAQLLVARRARLGGGRGRGGHRPGHVGRFGDGRGPWAAPWNACSGLPGRSRRAAGLPPTGPDGRGEAAAGEGGSLPPLPPAPHQGRGASAEEGPAEDPQQAVGPGEPPEEKGLPGQSREQGAGLHGPERPAAGEGAAAAEAEYVPAGAAAEAAGPGPTLLRQDRGGRHRRPGPALLLLPSLHPLGGRQPALGQPGVLSRKLREFPGGPSWTSADAPQQAEVARPLPPGPPMALSPGMTTSPKSFGAPGSLNGSLEAPQSTPGPQPPSAGNGSSSDPPPPALEGLLLTPEPPPPGKEGSLLPAPIDQQPAWAEGAPRVILQPHRTDEM